MAQELGADLWHMWNAHGSYGFRSPDPESPFAIRVKRLPRVLLVILMADSEHVVATRQGDRPSQPVEPLGIVGVDLGIRRENLRLKACGSSDRVVGRTSDPQLDRTNQRVEVIATNDVVSEDYYSAPAAAPTTESGTASANEEHGE